MLLTASEMAALQAAILSSENGISENIEYAIDEKWLTPADKQRMLLAMDSIDRKCAELGVRYPRGWQRGED